MHYLYSLSVAELENLIEKKLRIKNWRVYDLPAQERLEEIKQRSYYRILQQRAEEQGIKAKPAEILSWLDTLNLLYYSIHHANLTVLNDDLTIIQEYQIPFSRKRADYVLVYKNKILIVEFSFDRLGDTYKYETKLNQAIGYKELLTNVLSNHIEIGTYTFIINPEIDADGNEITKWNKYDKEQDLANNETIHEFGCYISRFFNKEDCLAISQLHFIDGYVAGMENVDYGEDDFED